jgi:hypothetical protein
VTVGMTRVTNPTSSTRQKIAWKDDYYHMRQEDDGRVYSGLMLPQARPTCPISCGKSA